MNVTVSIATPGPQRAHHAGARFFGWTASRRTRRAPVTSSPRRIERPAISDTLCDPDRPEALPPLVVDEPTIA